MDYKLTTYQDYEAATNKADFIDHFVANYKGTDLYLMAKDADLYDKQKNSGIEDVTKFVYSLKTQKTADGETVGYQTKSDDFTAANNKIASNFFRALNIQRATYLLGNGINFKDEAEKEKFGGNFDKLMYKAGYAALIHGVSYLFWNLDHIDVFKATEFAPLYDEDTGKLRAGVRFWQLGTGKPITYVLYTEEGYTTYRKGDGAIAEVKPLRAYKTRTITTVANGTEEIGGENYSAFPIVPFYGSELKQSTLVGMKAQIDAYDVVRSGFANDLHDCAEIYWLVKNYGGMSPNDLSLWRDKLKLMHIAEIDSTDGGDVRPYTQDVPTEGRTRFLDQMRKQIYEDFGAFDVSTVSAGATATQINASYQPLDERADDFEYCVTDAVKAVAKIAEIGDVEPIYKRNRVSNQLEQVQMVAIEAQYLDDRTVLSLLPNITVDQIDEILKNRDNQDLAKMLAGGDLS